MFRCARSVHPWSQCAVENLVLGKKKVISRGHGATVLSFAPT
jgi:hypothetical protein